MSASQHFSALKGREADIERMAFVATVVFAGATFWFSPRLPMTDLAQHAGQVAAWRDLLLGTSKWQPLLYLNYFTPYLVGYGLALLLSFILPVSAALTLLLTLAYYGFVAACVALRQRLGSDRRLDWLFIPGVFGYAYAWGLYTFLIAAPLGVLFVLLAHRYADRPTPALGIVLFLADLALFFSHGLVFLFANCIGGAFLLLRCRRLARLLHCPMWRPACCASSMRWSACASKPTRPASLLDITWDWDLGRLNFLIFSMGWPVGGIEADWNFGPLLLLALAAPWVLGARPNRLEPTALIPLLVTLLAWALVPLAAVSTWFLYQRFAVFLLPFYALIFRAPDPAAAGGVLRLIWLPVLCWAFLAVHAERLLAFATESAAFDEVLAVTQPGHRALGLILDPASAASGSITAYAHFPMWYQVEKRGFVDFNFAGFLPQIVRYRPEHVPPAFADRVWAWRPAKEFVWTQYQAGIYRYFFVRRKGGLAAGLFPDRAMRARPAEISRRLVGLRKRELSLGRQLKARA